jgi:hypothetical protein
MMKSKKLQASIIVGILFVLLSVATVSTVYVFMKKNVDTNTAQAGTVGDCISTIGQFDFTSGTCYNSTSNKVMVVIKRSNENYNLKSLSFFLEDASGSSKTYEQLTDLPGSNDARVYTLDATALGLSSVSKIRVIPVLESVGICTDGQAEKVLNECSGGSIIVNPPLNPVYSWCYQETADIAPACGGLSTGVYIPGVNWNNGGTNTYDGLWNNYDYRSSNGQANLYINYSVPAKAVNSSIWQVEDSLATINLSIASCWGDTLQFRVTSYYYSSYPALYFANWSCYNQSSWLGLRYTSSASSNSYSRVYEEAMIWNMSN